MTKKQLRPVAFPLILKASADGSLPKELEIAKTGFWSTPWKGEFELTIDDFDEAVAHFNAGVYRVNGTEPLAGTLDHLGGESPAAFRITNAYRVGESLWASVEWTELGKEKLARDEYRYVSFEYATRKQPFVNPENVNDVLVNVLTGATLTNDPLFKDLRPVLASARSGDRSNQEGDDMDLKAILAKKAEELSDEEKAFLNEHKAELTDEQRTAFGIEADDEETPEAKEKREAEEKAAADKEAADKAAADAKAAEEAQKLEASTKGMSAAQKAEFARLHASVKALEAKAQAGVEASQELLKTRLTASVQANVNRGAIKTDQLDSAVDILMASTEADRTKLQAFLDALPSNELLKAEAGHGGDAPTSVELTAEEKSYGADFGLTPEEIADYKKQQAEAK